MGQRMAKCALSIDRDKRRLLLSHASTKKCIYLGLGIMKILIRIACL